MVFYLGGINPGVAQLVACLTGGQEAAGSSPVTRTMRSITKGSERSADDTPHFLFPSLYSDLCGGVAKCYAFSCFQLCLSTNPRLPQLIKDRNADFCPAGAMDDTNIILLYYRIYYYLISKVHLANFPLDGIEKFRIMKLESF